MAFEWEEYQEHINNLSENASDPVILAETITTLSEDYSNVIKERTQLERDISDKDEMISKLTQANTRLTLSVGDAFAPPETVRRKKENDELQNVTLDMIKERKLV